METDKWGRRIRAFRKLKGFTQEGLAKEIEISVSVLGEIERGSRLPSEPVLEKISEILGVSMEELTPQEEQDE
ncbi:helix-turn-helix domain-containing protein [Lederbergia citrea]|uniref:Helix-turn-helix transcriptional regulator n=1 Tax=Lederbergia citrea TaxID=2833581 RepID=A0A942UWB8_9BACI|nr:helix-turn-helix transcriptional regulator [Lederbergia citrea]MBS4179707.1 helix-turn-helix transcriptional regulator [Lederbergia citrea]MBS4206444.1 helix-turn-helix transcriptional regulator [Lederbergia citrea]MBS4225064.1 helix-turn-helix transcriptional regulator [Lederbergia citrea]